MITLSRIYKQRETFSINCFGGQCTPLKNSSVVPTKQIFLTQARLGSLEFNEKEILKIIIALNINKAHGQDDISIRMIKYETYPY